MGFSKQECWSGLPCPLPGDFPIPGIEPGSLMSPAWAVGFFTTSATWKTIRGHSVQFSSFQSLSRVRLFETLWTVACQAPLSVGFSRQEYWSGLPCPLPGDLPDPGIKPVSLMSPELAGVFFITSATYFSYLVL